MTSKAQTDLRDVTESLAWEKSSLLSIPGNTSTLAKSPSRLVRGVSPLCSVSAKGAFFTDVDGNQWLDCEMAMGTVPWGHAHPEVVEAVIRQVKTGTSFSTAHRSELVLAELLLNRFPRYDALRFLKSGADAVSGAIRIARAATARAIVVATEYHGWSDWSAAGMYASLHGESLGISDATMRETLFSPRGDIEGMLELLLSEGPRIAAVVICPNNWRAEDVARIQNAIGLAGALLIFDEVTSGMRIGRQATAGRYGIWPDLLCISKGLTNGLPLAVLFGDNDLIARCEAAKITTAHATEATAFAAAIACEHLLLASPSWPSWESATDRLMRNLESRMWELGLGDRVALTGDYASFSLMVAGHENFWTDPLRERVIRTLAQNGIFSKGYVVLSDAHTQSNVDQIQGALFEALEIFSRTSPNGKTVK